MAEKTMNVKVLQIVKTTLEWSLVDKVIDKGLLCIEFTEDNQALAKVGDGVHLYDALPYIGTAPVSLSNFYTKSETDLAIQEALDNVNFGTISVKGIKPDVESLPENPSAGDMWFVGPNEGTTDEYEQYVYTETDGWVDIGTRESTEIDLSDYVNKTEFNALKQTVDLLKLEQNPHENRLILDQITAPFTTELETKLNNIEVFTGAIAEDTEQGIEGQDGTSGLVPAPTAGDASKFLRADGTWVAVESAAYDDTALSQRITAIEEDYLKSTDELVLQCSI